jgi:hypothetical protein
MRIAIALAACVAPLAATTSRASEPQELANPAIDATAFLRVAEDAMRSRAAHRLSEAEFIRMSHEPGTVVLDARSRDMFELLHVDGAVNLSFPDITVASLARLLPDKQVRILIYCNNNFAQAEDAFPSKLPSASLNLSTYTALYDYGYRNVWELGPLIDARSTTIRLVPSR